MEPQAKLEKLELGMGFHIMVSPEDDTIGIDNFVKLLEFAVHVKNKWEKITSDGKITFWEKLKLAGLSKDLLKILQNGKDIVREAENFSEPELLRLYAILDDGFEFKGNVDALFEQGLDLLRMGSKLSERFA